MARKTRLDRMSEALVKGIKAVMAMTGMTREDLANTINVSEASLYNWLRDPTKISLKNLNSLEIVMEANHIDWRTFI